MISAYCITQNPDGISLQKAFERDDLRSLDQANRLIPDGVYTTFRTFEKFHVLDLEGHFDRLEGSAQLLGRELKLNRQAIRNALSELLKNFPAAEARVRISIPFTTENRDNLQIYIFLEKLVLPSLRDYQNGVRVITIRMHRENPAAKTTAFIHTADEIRRKLPKGINEAIMVDENGCMLEGLSSNFFAVKDGTIFTDDQHVLAGITRKQVLEIIQELAIPLRYEGFPYAELKTLDEAFLTSTSRGVLPIHQIDDQIIGQGMVGEITQKIMERYQKKIQKAVQPI